MGRALYTRRRLTLGIALVLMVVGAFSVSGITFIKLMGVGMIVALLVDATIIRPLRRLYARYGIRDEIQAERAGVPV
jgi:trehalose monomycolate/heme transporter